MDTTTATTTAVLPSNTYETPPIHPKLSLRHILNSTLDLQRYRTRGAGFADGANPPGDRRQQQRPPSSAYDQRHTDAPFITNATIAVANVNTSTTAATHGSTSVRHLDSSSAALPRTHYYNNTAAAGITSTTTTTQQRQLSSSLPAQPFTRYRTRNRALSNLSNVSFPSTAISTCRQSRRPATRAAASGTTGDENKVAPVARSSKNAGLALRSRNTNIASSAPSSQKGGKLDLSSAANSRRRALADSSNKVAPQLAAGGKGGKGTDKERLVIVVEDNAPPAATARGGSAAGAGRPALVRRSTRNSLTSAETADTITGEDAAMDVVEAETRPIKSMRHSTATSNQAGSSKLPASSRNAGGVLAGRSSNVPRPSNSNANVGSTKNAGLKRSFKSSSVAPAPEVSVEIKKSTKNAGLRLKREIQALESDDHSGDLSSGRKASSSQGDVDESKSARAERDERRRSKRLRQSDPEAGAEDAALPSTSGSAAFRSTASEQEAEQEAATAAIRRVITVPDDDDDEAFMNGDHENMYEEAKDAGWEDLDIGDEDDPLMVTEYVVEIHEYMKELELQTRPDPHYMDRQSEVNWKMRSILVDWLIEVHGKFRLLPETIFLAVNIMDRLLSIRTIALVKLQLVGIVSLQIASKYEEVVCPSVSSFLYMTDGCYDEEQLLAAERYVLKQIDFNLSYPNPINFLRRISKADGYDIQTRTVAKYFIEMSCVERKFIQYTPSMVAAAGMWLARKVLDRGYWGANLVHYSTYSQLELLPCAQLMLDYVLRRSQAPGEPIEHPHFYKKYSAKKFYKAAELVRQWAERRYLVRKPSVAAGTAYGAVTTLFTGLEGGGRLEEWEDEGEEIPEVDYG